MSQTLSQTVEFTCPHCGKAILAPARHAGQAGRCPNPNCNQRVVVPGAADKAAVMKVDREDRKLTTTDPNPALTVLIGAAAAAALYLIVFFPLHHAYLGRLMIDRGPCQYLSTFITCWGLATLALKFYAVKQQASYAELELDFIPYDINMQITPRNVGKFLQHVAGMQPTARGSILGRRILVPWSIFGRATKCPRCKPICRRSIRWTPPPSSPVTRCSRRLSGWCRSSGSSAR